VLEQRSLALVRERGLPHVNRPQLVQNIRRPSGTRPARPGDRAWRSVLSTRGQYADRTALAAAPARPGRVCVSPAMQPSCKCDTAMLARPG
jgi:hypothetical protein